MKSVAASKRWVYRWVSPVPKEKLTDDEEDDPQAE